MNIGVQTYCLHKTGLPLEEKLKTIKRLGYTHVEFAGFDGHTAQDVAAMLKATDLHVYGAHERYDSFGQRLHEIITFNQLIGNRMIAIPRPQLNSRADIETLIENLIKWDQQLQDEGLVLYYHNHDFEFREIDGVIAMDEILSKTAVKLEIDVYWAYRSGIDVMNFINKNRKRILYLHLKDGDAKSSSAVGLGILPCKDYILAAAKSGFGIIVEDDSQLPDGITSISNSIKTIRQFALS